MATLVLLSSALLLSPTRPAFAASNGAWSVFPTTPAGQQTRAFFQPLMAANSTYPDSVTVANQTTAPLTFNLYPADGYNTANGGFSLRQRADAQHDVGAWIHLAVSRVTVPAKTAAKVPFVITVPADATPGFHVGGIVAEATTGTTTKKGAVGVTIQQAVGTRVYARVIGNLQPQLAITSMSIETKSSSSSTLGGSVMPTVKFTVENTGNVPLSGKTKIDLSPLFGSGPHPIFRTLPQVLPHNATAFSVAFPSVAAHGYLSATTTVTARGIHPVTATTSTVVFPWLLFLIVLVVIVGIAIWIFMRRRRARIAAPSTAA